jgi:ATP-dependent 26S proteasome regulatory subunit
VIILSVAVSFQDIPLPEPETISELLKINLKDVPLAEDVKLDELAQKMKGYSGADITGVNQTSYFYHRKSRDTIIIQGLPRCCDDATSPPYSRSHTR